MDAHNGTKLVRVIKLNSLQFKLSFVNFHGTILKRRKNHRNRARKDKTFSFSIPYPFLSLSIVRSFSLTVIAFVIKKNVSREDEDLKFYSKTSFTKIAKYSFHVFFKFCEYEGQKLKFYLKNCIT